MQATTANTCPTQARVPKNSYPLRCVSEPVLLCSVALGRKAASQGDSGSNFRTNMRLSLVLIGLAAVAATQVSQHRAPCPVTSIQIPVGDGVPLLSCGLGQVWAGWQALDPAASSPALTLGSTLCPNRSFVPVPRLPSIPQRPVHLEPLGNSPTAKAVWFNEDQRALLWGDVGSLAAPASACAPSPVGSTGDWVVKKGPYLIHTHDWLEGEVAAAALGQGGAITAVIAGSVGAVAFENTTAQPPAGAPASGGGQVPQRDWYSATAAVQVLRASPGSSNSEATSRVRLTCPGEPLPGSCLPGARDAPAAGVVRDIALVTCVLPCVPGAGALSYTRYTTLVVGVNLTSGAFAWPPSAGVLGSNSDSKLSLPYFTATPPAIVGDWAIVGTAAADHSVFVVDPVSGAVASRWNGSLPALQPPAHNPNAWQSQAVPTLHSSWAVQGNSAYTYSSEGNMLRFDVSPAGGASLRWTFNILQAPEGGVPQWSYEPVPTGKVYNWPTPDAASVQFLAGHTTSAGTCRYLGGGYTWDMSNLRLSSHQRQVMGRVGWAGGRFVRQGEAVVLAELCPAGGACNVSQVLRVPCTFGSCLTALVAAGEGPAHIARAGTPHALVHSASGQSQFHPLPPCGADLEAAATDVSLPASIGFIGPPLLVRGDEAVAPVHVSDDDAADPQRLLYRAVAPTLYDGALHAVDRVTHSAHGPGHVSLNASAWRPAWRVQPDSGCAFLPASPAALQRRFVASYVPSLGACPSQALFGVPQVCINARDAQGRAVLSRVARSVQVVYVCAADGAVMWKSAPAKQWETNAALNAYQAEGGGVSFLRGWYALTNASAEWHPVQPIVTTEFSAGRNATSPGSSGVVPLTLLLSNAFGTIVALNGLAGAPLLPPSAAKLAGSTLLWSSHTSQARHGWRHAPPPRVLQWGTKAHVLSPDSQQHQPAFATTNGPALLRVAGWREGALLAGQGAVTGYWLQGAMGGTFQHLGGRGGWELPEVQSSASGEEGGGAPQTYGSHLYSSSSAYARAATGTTHEGSGWLATSTSYSGQDDIVERGVPGTTAPSEEPGSAAVAADVQVAFFEGIPYVGILTSGRGQTTLLVRPSALFNNANARYLQAARMREMATMRFSECVGGPRSASFLMRPDLDRTFIGCIAGEAGQDLLVSSLHFWSGAPAWRLRVPRAGYATATLRNCTSPPCPGQGYPPGLSNLFILSKSASPAGFATITGVEALRRFSSEQVESGASSLADAVLYVMASDGAGLAVSAGDSSIQWLSSASPAFELDPPPPFAAMDSSAPVARAAPDSASGAMVLSGVHTGLVAVRGEAVQLTFSPVAPLPSTEGLLKTATIIVICVAVVLGVLFLGVFAYAACRQRCCGASTTAALGAPLLTRKVVVEPSDTADSDDAHAAYLQSVADYQQMLWAVVHPAFNIYGAAAVIFSSQGAAAAGDAGTLSATLNRAIGLSSASGEVQDPEAQQAALADQLDTVLILSFFQLALSAFHFVVHIYFFFIALSAAMAYGKGLCSREVGSRYQQLSQANGSVSIGMWPMGIINTLILLVAFNPRDANSWVALVGAVVSWAGSLTVPAVGPAPDASQASITGVNSAASKSASEAQRAARQDPTAVESCTPAWLSSSAGWYVGAVVRGWVALMFVAIFVLFLPLLGLFLQLVAENGQGGHVFTLLAFGVQVPVWVQLGQANGIELHDIASASSTLAALISTAWSLLIILLLPTLYYVSIFTWTRRMPVCSTVVCSPTCLHGTHRVMCGTGASQASDDQKCCSCRARCVPSQRMWDTSPCWGCMGLPPVAAWWLATSAWHSLVVVLVTVALALRLPIVGPSDDAGDFGPTFSTDVFGDFLGTEWYSADLAGPFAPDGMGGPFDPGRESLWPAANTAWYFTLVLQYIVLAPFALCLAYAGVVLTCVLALFVYSLVVLVGFGSLLFFANALWVYLCQPIIAPPETEVVMSPTRHADASTGHWKCLAPFPDPLRWWGGAIPYCGLFPGMQAVLECLTGRRPDEPSLPLPEARPVPVSMETAKLPPSSPSTTSCASPTEHKQGAPFRATFIPSQTGAMAGPAAFLAVPPDAARTLQELGYVRQATRAASDPLAWREHEAWEGDMGGAAHA